MPTITFSGLSSGLDTESIISSLVEVKTQQLITPLQNRIVNITGKQTALSSIQTLLSNFKSAANSLRTSAIEGRSATSTDTDVVSIDSISSTAVNGSYDIAVTALATTDKVYFTGEADKDTTTFGTGTITITSDGVARTVAIDGTNNTLAGIAEAINETAGMNVTAAVINDGGANPYRLVLTSLGTGVDANITHDLDTVLTGLAVDAGLTASNNAADASLTVNGLPVTGSTNTFSEVIPGVTFTIRDDSGGPSTAQVDVADDFSATKSTINNFVSYFNALIAGFHDQFDYDETTESLGPLGADVAMQNIQTQVNKIVFNIYGGLGNLDIKALSHIGISVDSDGMMSVDSAKLDDALTTNVEEVKTLFQGPEADDIDGDGLMEKLYNYLSTLDNAASGILTNKTQIFSDTIDDLNDLIDDREDRIDVYEEGLRARYAALEIALSEVESMEQMIANFSEQMSNMTKRR